MLTSLRLMLVFIALVFIATASASPDLVRLRSGVGLVGAPIQLSGTLDVNRNGRPELLVSGRFFITIVEEDDSPRRYREIARVDAPAFSQFWGALLVDVPGEAPALLLRWNTRTELRDTATLAIKATIPDFVDSASIGDVDGDGYPEIVAHVAGTVALFDPITLEPRGIVPLIISGTTVGDILGDARAEIISNDGRAFTITRNGDTLSATEVWNAGFSGPFNPYVINFQGQNAIVLHDAFGYSAQLATFRPAAPLRTIVPSTGPSFQSIFADANGDGSIDLITATSRELRALDIATGLTLWERDTVYQSPTIGFVYQAVTIDLNGDGMAELVWADASYLGGIVAMSIPPSGLPRWRTYANQYQVTDWTLVARPDGKPSLAYLTPLGTIGFLVGSTLSDSPFADQAGSALPAAGRSVVQYAITSSPLQDANGEVVVAGGEYQQGASSSTRHLWTFAGSGALISERTLQSSTYPQSIATAQLLDRPERQLIVAGRMSDPVSGQPANAARVEIVDYATGNLLWQSVPLPMSEGAAMGELRVADMDADGVPEIIFAYLADIRVFKPLIGPDVVASYTAVEFSLLNRGAGRNTKMAILRGTEVAVYDGLSATPEKMFALPSYVYGIALVSQAPDDVLMFATSDYSGTTVRRYDDGEIVTSNVRFPSLSLEAIDVNGDNRIELIGSDLNIWQLENDYIFRGDFDQPAQ